MSEFKVAVCIVLGLVAGFAQAQDAATLQAAERRGAALFDLDRVIQAARAIVADAHMDERAKMRAFWRKGEPPAISNAQRVGFHWQDGCWECAPAIAA